MSPDTPVERAIELARARVATSTTSDIVAHRATNASSFAPTQAIVSLGHSLGLRVAAEGIEQPEQVALLQKMLCDAGQGAYFARPPDAGQMAASLRRAV